MLLLFLVLVCISGVTGVMGLEVTLSRRVSGDGGFGEPDDMDGDREDMDEEEDEEDESSGI